MISVGKYPRISMKQARAKQREFMDMLEQGVNPSVHKQSQKIKMATQKTFKAVALEWHTKHNNHGNARHNKLTLQRLEKYLFPTIGKIPLIDIEAPMLFNLIEAIQDQGYIETGKRVNSCCSMICRYGVAKGYCQRDLTQDYRGMLKNAKVKHMPTLVDSSDIGELLNDIDGYNGTIIVKTALIISAYVFVRPSELAKSKWEYINFDTSHWLIPAQLMKMRRDHLIPIPRQVTALLKALQPITGNDEYIFPNDKALTKAMHSETVNKALRRIEDGKYIGRMVSHGFRGMASTILNEHRFRPDIIEKRVITESGV